MRVLVLVLVLYFVTTEAAPRWAKRVLAQHNALRRKKGLKSLVWSNALSQMAAQTTSRCLTTHDSDSLRKQGVGENLAWGASPTRSFQLWAEERKWYNLRRNSCASGKQCGHYTAIVWKGTRKVGCSFNPKCSVVGSGMVSCRYWPAGNYIGVKPYGSRGAGRVVKTLGTYRGGSRPVARGAVFNPVTGTYGFTTVQEVAMLTGLVFLFGLSVTVIVALVMVCMSATKASGKGGYSLMYESEQGTRGTSNSFLSGPQKAAIIVLAVLTVLATIGVGVYFGLTMQSPQAANPTRSGSIARSGLVTQPQPQSILESEDPTKSFDEEENDGSDIPETQPAEVSGYSPFEKGLLCAETSCPIDQVRKRSSDGTACLCVPKRRRIRTCSTMRCVNDRVSIPSRGCRRQPCCKCVKKDEARKASKDARENAVQALRIDRSEGRSRRRRSSSRSRRRSSRRDD